jgi:hypothetical protein
MVGAGDIIQYADAGGTTKHSQMVYGIYPNGDINIAQHTTNEYRWLKDSLSKSPYSYVFIYKIKKSTT